MAGPDGTEVNHEPGIAVPDGTRSHKRVCGFRKTTFFLALALLLVVLAAIIGGAVGGTVSKRGASASSPQDAASTA